MSLRVGCIKQGIVYAANLLYEDSDTPLRGRCIMSSGTTLFLFLSTEGIYAMCHIVIVGIAWLVYLESGLEK